MKVFLKGLNGCPMRYQKLKQYKEFLIANGHQIENNAENSDMCLLWTCSFRGDALNNSISEIERYQKDYNCELIVAGCLPYIAPDELKKHFSGRVINWRDDEKKIEEYFGGSEKSSEEFSPIFVEEKFCDDAEEYRKEHPDKDVTFHDQFIKLVISEGCNYKCAYCSEKLAFPPYRSFPEDKLVKSCKRMIEDTGQFDVILLADSLDAYGRDIGSSLPALIKKLKTIHPKIRFALNNLNPAGFIKYYDELTEFIKNGDIKHLNLPIQSASSRILKLMKRDYTRSDINKIFGLLNNICFTEFDTHIIVGFPGETEEDLENTIQFIIRYKPKYVLASRYLEVPAMPSANLPDKVNEEKQINRLHRVATEVKKAGIICNFEEGDIMNSRFKRIISDKRI